MEKTNQTPPEKDEAFEDIKAKLPFDPDEKKDADKGKSDSESHEEEEEDKKDKAEEDQPAKDPKKDDDEKEEEVEKKPSRSERYIPLDQYTDEKERWKGTLEEKDKRIAELEILAKKPADSKKFEDAVKRYAEKHDVDEETAKAEVERVRDILDFTSSKEEDNPKKEFKLSPEQQQEIDEARQIKAEQAFNEEYRNVAVPQLKEVFPNATSEQIESAKEEIEKLATTKKYLDKSLDYVIFKEKNALNEYFESERKGPESSRAPQKGKQTFTAKDFEAGKADFEDLSKLSPEEKNNVIKSFSVKTWDKYTHWLSMNEELEID